MRFVLVCLLALGARAHAEDCERVAIWRDGKRAEVICRDDASGRGLTVIDLGEDWTPTALAGGAGGEPSYRAIYLALAQERFAAAGLDGTLGARDRYLELHGIAPTLRVIRDRLSDQARHACHAAAGELASDAPRIVEESHRDARARRQRAASLRAELERARKRKQAASLEALAASSKSVRAAFDRLRAIEARFAAIRTIQAHLRCDGLFEHPPIDGAYTWQTSNAVERFQRGSMILPTGTVDETTREALRHDSRERDFRAALRVLRERLIAATGWIEDGSAGTGEAPVLGRSLVPATTWRVRGHEPLAGAAADLVSPATETAARALGWLDADGVRGSLELLLAGEGEPKLVAIELPPPPAYHGDAMQLAIEIDRGDVWHDPRPTWRDAARRPALIVYAVTRDRRIPLVRWPTTIGGWQKQKVDGDVEQRWMESPVGRRIWRDLYVGPTWRPPPSTPDRELVRRTNKHYELAREQFGPSYRAAFGMIAFIHLVEERERDGVEYWDQGVRSHGTGNLLSLAHGVSHGCHRLLGYHVVRLAEMVLAHHPHVRRGDTPTHYRRVVRAAGKRFALAVDSLGYRIELVPPIEVNVLPGRIHRP